ncbi:DUF4244 domain-containing protein [Falsigemmobacter intermedius]|uniref:DUF4244 domain-containing protein n=1 Tax=Falsigemmobacter intermedius TaxID=1553448 RepID=UPI003F028FF6
MMYSLLNAVRNFKKSESGAVTVDWVVLTAAVVALGGVFVAVLSDGDLADSFKAVIAGAL